MADKLANIIALKRVESIFLSAEQTLKKIVKREKEKKNLLVFCELESSALLAKQKDLLCQIDKENELISLLNDEIINLHLKQKVLNESQQEFLLKKNEQSDVCKYLNGVKQTLCDDVDFFDLDDEFQGNDWYLPLSFTCFDSLSEAMDWQLPEIRKWAELFDESEKYHKNISGGMRSLPYGLFQFYVTDLYKTDSPRKQLLEAINERIQSFNEIETNQTNHELQKINEMRLMCLEDINAHKITIKEIDFALKQLTLKLLEKKSFQEKIHTQSQEMIRQHQFADICVSFRYIIPLYTEWVNLSELKPEIKRDALAKEAYQKIMGYQELLKAFSLKLEQSLKENNYNEIKASLNLDGLNTQLEDELFTLFQQAFNLPDELLKKNRALTELYESLHDDCFKRLQSDVKIKKLQVDAKKIARNQEINGRKINLHNYLGGEEDAGDLNNYLMQRNATYWWQDFFSSVIALLFHCPFGYVTEKEKRTQFINDELRPALESYEKSGKNDELAKLICSPPAFFFKPRTRNNHSYCLTLEFMLDNMRQELLTKEQVAEYYERNESLQQYEM